MKNIKLLGTFIFAVATMLSAQFSSAQLYREPGPVEHLPKIVEETFIKKFGDKKPQWHVRYRGEDENRQRYEGKFVMDNRTTSAVFSKDGVLEAMVFEVTLNEVPKEARDYMEKNYKQKITETTMIVDNKEPRRTFEIGFYLDNVFKLCVFDDKGNFLKLTNG